MADGYLESRYADYEKRKAQWLKQHKHRPARADKPDDEAL